MYRSRADTKQKRLMWPDCLFGVVPQPTDSRLSETRGKPAKRRRDELDDYWKGTIWQKIAQDRHILKLHAEAFAQPRDTMAAQ